MIRIPLSVDGDKTEKKFCFQNMYPNAYGRGLNVSRETTLNFGLFGARTETNKDNKDWIS